MALEAATRVLSFIAVLALVAGCQETYVEADDNLRPEAVARAFDASGTRVDSSANDGLGPIFPFDGEAVEIKLDGRGSTDMDGTIAEYRWLSATQRDAGADRIVPDGEDAGWPDDEAQPRVTLDEGSWTFSLWVIDDRGAFSDPATIDLVVGEPPE